MRVVIAVELDVVGEQFKSTHYPLAPEDHDALLSLPAHGQGLVVDALLTEAVRREAHVILGWLASTDEARLKRIRSHDARELAETSAQLLSAFEIILKKMAQPALLEALAHVGEGLTGVSPHPEGVSTSEGGTGR
jgi:uncharacterized protein (DUF885 family)